MSDARPPIVLIHGLWMTGRSWEGWAARYREAGHEVVDASWPGVADDPYAVRRDPSALAGLGAADILDHYASIIRDLATPPIIMGHSFGGTFAQVLLDRGLGAAGVAIHSAAIKGVKKLPLSTLRSALPVLKRPGNRRRAVPLTLAQFQWRFTNDLTLEEARPLYERYCVPAAGRVLFEGATANLRRRSPLAIDRSNSGRPPLLLVAGDADHVSPPRLVRAIARLQQRTGAPTELLVVPDRTHLTLAQPGWETVADHVLHWAVSATRTSPAEPHTSTTAR